MCNGRFTALVTASDYRTPNMQVASVEPQPAKTSRRRLARFGELSRKRHHPSVDRSTDQSRRLSGTGTVHARWSPVHHVLHDGQSDQRRD